jgi:methylase of polypeptide subunit release factors
VLELGSGYGLAGLAVAASTNAAEVVISDGNPQVVGCILLKSFHAQIIFLLVSCNSISDHFIPDISPQ